MAVAILIWICLSIVACLALLRAAAKRRVTPTLEDFAEGENQQISAEKRSSTSSEADPAPEKTLSHSLTE